MRTTAQRKALSLRLVVALFGVLAVAAIAMAIWLQPQRLAYLTDGRTVRLAEADAHVRDVMWMPPNQLPGHINTAADDYEARLSADGNTLFFVRGKAGGAADIYWAERLEDGSWGPTAPLDAVNTLQDDLGPAPSPDGRALYFYSDRPGGSGGFDLWVTRRVPSGWGAAVNLGTHVNSPFNDYGPAVSSGGGLLYFASNRPIDPAQLEAEPDWSATMREEQQPQSYDLYTAGLGPHGADAASPLKSLNTSANEGSPELSRAGDFLYFASDRSEGQGGFDLYRARILRGAHQPPENLGPAVNTPANELDPSLALGGFGLIFSSDRVVGGDAAEPDYDLYYSESREVFTAYETQQRRVDWATLWQQLGPHLLWLIVALVAMLLLLAMMRRGRYGRLDLLARCLLASLFFHLVVLLLLSFWKVAAVFADVVRDGHGTHVTLMESPADGGLAGQILGGLTAVDAPQSTPVELAQADAAVEVAMSSASVVTTVQSKAPRVPETSHATFNVAESHLQAPSVPQHKTEFTEFDQGIDIAVPQDVTPQHHDEPMMEGSVRPDQSFAERPTQVASAIELPSHDDVKIVPQTDATLMTRLTAESAVRTAVPQDTTFEMQRPELETVAVVPTTDTGVAPRQLPRLEEDVAREAIEPQMHVPAESGISRAPQNEVVPEPRTVTVVESSVDHTATVTGERVHLPASPSGAEVQVDRPVAEVASIPPTSMTVDLPGLEEQATTAHAEPRLAIRPPRLDAASSAVEAEVVPSIATDLDVEVVTAPEILRMQLDRSTEAERYELQSMDLPAGSGAGVASTVEPLNIPIEVDLPSLEEERARIDEPSQIATAPLHTTPQQIADPQPFDAVVDQPRIQRFEPADVQPGDAMSMTELVALNPSAAPTAPTFADAIPALDMSLDSILPLELPSETEIPEAYTGRSRTTRLDLVERMGGSDRTERAVALALEWLERHQSSDGRWDADGFDNRCGQCGGTTHIAADMALTSLSVLCFLAADHTHTKAGPYQDTVDRALDWILRHQEDDGDLRTGESMYSHGIGAIALAEGYGMTGDPKLEDAVRRAIDFINRARNRTVGGWRYDPGQAGDTSVLGWQVMALKSAERAGVSVPEGSYRVARKWLDRVTRPEYPGRYSYRPGQRPSPAMTAEAMFARQILGAEPAQVHMQRSADYLIANLPDWSTQPNTYYWYYATLALYQHQGQAWHIWNDAMTDTLVPSQRQDGRVAGSWDPIDRWAKVGGRVYQTALCTLMLESYYRYLPMYSIIEP